MFSFFKREKYTESGILKEHAKVIDQAIGRNQDAWEILEGKWPGKWTNANEVFGTPTVIDMERAYNHPIIRACVSIGA